MTRKNEPIFGRNHETLSSRGGLVGIRVESSGFETTGTNSMKPGLSCNKRSIYFVTHASAAGFLMP